MTIALASNNQHKLKEIQEIIPNIEIISPNTLDIHFDPLETGSSFSENAWIKAEHLYALLDERNLIKQLGIDAVIADDSGICVDALNGKPGIYSARYGSDDQINPCLSDSDRNLKLLSELSDIEDGPDRSARYICAISVLFESNRFISVQDSMEGRIALQPSSGSGGFGYDPIFFIPEYGKHVADLTDAEKHRISHRGKAMRSALSAMQTALSELG